MSGPGGGGDFHRTRSILASGSKAGVKKSVRISNAVDEQRAGAVNLPTPRSGASEPEQPDLLTQLDTNGGAQPRSKHQAPKRKQEVEILLPPDAQTLPRGQESLSYSRLPAPIEVDINFPTNILTEPKLFLSEELEQTKAIKICEDQSYENFMDFIQNEFGHVMWPVLDNMDTGVQTLIDNDNKFDMICEEAEEAGGRLKLLVMNQPPPFYDSD